MSWPELNREAGTWTVPAERAKNGRAHTLTLPPMAWALIEATPRRVWSEYLFGRGDHGFNGWGTAKQGPISAPRSNLGCCTICAARPPPAWLRLASGRTNLEGTSTVGGTLFFGPSPQPPLFATQAFRHSNVNTGWVVGTGTEGKLLIPGWTYKIEGLYMNLGHLDATGPGAFQRLTSFVTPDVTVGPTTMHTHFTDTILRLEANYQFH
jgi:hypothetical protein